jgi:hypothetical protein
MDFFGKILSGFFSLLTLNFSLLTVFYNCFYGGVPKWLRERSAKPLCSGSNPLAASIKKRFKQRGVKFPLFEVFPFECFYIKPVKSAVAEKVFSQ